MTILITTLVVALILATFASSFCRGATVSLPKEVPAPIDFGDALVVATAPVSANRVLFPSQIFSKAGVALALVMTVHNVSDNCLVRLYTNTQTNTIEATSIEWTAKQSKTDLTESQCDKRAGEWLESGDNE